MNKRQEFLNKLIQLEKEYNMYITSDAGRIGVYVEDKETEEILCTLDD